MPDILIPDVRSPELTGGDILSAQLDFYGVDKEEPEGWSRSDFDRTSKNLFRFVLADDDPRWRFVYHILRLKSERIFRPKDLDHALRADYLSEAFPTKMYGFSQFGGLEPAIHLARALKNIEVGRRLMDELNTSLNKRSESLHEEVYLTYEVARTGKNYIPDSRGVMGMPEALWQVLFIKNKSFFGRVGFNFHQEGDIAVVSIVNIQGRKNARREIKRLEASIGGYLANFLVITLKESLEGITRFSFEFRGIAGLDENPIMYKKAFANAGIPTVKTTRPFLGRKRE